MMNYLKKAFIVPAVVLLLSGFVSQTSLANEMMNFAENALIQSEVGTPSAQLIDQTVNFNGEGYASFTYRGSANLRFYLKNIGDQFIKWNLKAPDGSSFMNGSLKADEDMVWTFYNDDFDRIPEGTFTIYVNNSDGSEGKFEISAHTLE